MNDDFQDVRVLAQEKDSCTVQVTYYPLNRPESCKRDLKRTLRRPAEAKSHNRTV
jgi:hypothetical protein